MNLAGPARGDAIKSFQAAAGAKLKAAGYPEKADPAQIDRPMAIAILTLLVIYVTMVYGPIAAMLVELFPARIRYTSMSLPYHIGNGWFGGFLPTIAFAIVAATGNIYSGLWYPVIVALRDRSHRRASPSGNARQAYRGLVDDRSGTECPPRPPGTRTMRRRAAVLPVALP